MDELSKICAGREPGFCQEARDFSNTLVENIKKREKKKREREQIKKKKKEKKIKKISKLVPKPLAVGKNQLVYRTFCKAFFLNGCAKGGTPLTSLSCLKQHSVG